MNQAQKLHTREADQATTEQPDKTKSNEIRRTWSKSTNLGDPNYLKRVLIPSCVTLQSLNRSDQRVAEEKKKKEKKKKKRRRMKTQVEKAP